MYIYYGWEDQTSVVGQIGVYTIFRNNISLLILELGHMKTF